mgnify:CR=1 FL=1
MNAIARPLPKSKERLDDLRETVDVSAQLLQSVYESCFIDEVSQLLEDYELPLCDFRKFLSGDQVEFVERSAKLKSASNRSDSHQEGAGSQTGAVRSRAEKTYLNPHTNQTIMLKSSKNKTLKLWQEQYGAEIVQGWLIG